MLTAYLKDGVRLDLTMGQSNLSFRTFTFNLTLILSSNRSRLHLFMHFASSLRLN